MKKCSKWIKDILITAVVLCVSFLICLLFQHIFDVHEHATIIFVFAVFLISVLTQGYVCGIFAAFAGTIAVNYAFTFPYFVLNFTIPVNLILAIVMIIISVLTSAFTTKLKRQEAMRAESEKERMRANLLRAVSHDLRTPLTTIYGSSAALLENNTAFTEAQKSKIIEGIKEDSEWLIRMVENLLSITRIDSGNVKIIKTPTVLEELIDSVILKLKKRYPTQNVKIEIPDTIIIIPMDAILIEQVLINILENAVRHAIGMTELSLNVLLNGNKAIFEIKDNGCGIPQDRMDTLFTGYYESKKESADSQKKNTGIGLSVCATIIKAHGGEIMAENMKNGGAMFRFTLDTEDLNSDEQ